jgi:integrase
MSGGPRKRSCARCGRDRFPAASFPEGHICGACLTTALRTRGRCPGCGADRMLPGRRGGAAVCRDCAGISRHFSCLRCGYEGELPASRLCGPCGLTWALGRTLDDGTGAISPALAPLAIHLASSPSPTAVLHWLNKPHIHGVLTDLATGRLPLTHQALAAHPDRRAVIYLRDLLVSCGVLPAADKQLLDYEAWLNRRLAALAGHPHERLLRQFGLWHQLARMRAKAARAPLRATARKYAETRFRQAEHFLTWLDSRGRRPSDLTEADIDTYYASHLIHQRQAVRAFFIWAIGHGHLRRLDVPRLRFAPGEAITQQRRLALLRRFVTDASMPLRPRAVACLMLLYAQPLSRILTLTVDDLNCEADGQTWLRLGDLPSPVPEPFAALLHQLAACRHNGTPANHGSRWLFPGRHAGQPVAYRSMLIQLRDLGLPMRTARISALRQLVLQAPAPVIADALGFHHTTTHRQHTNAGGTWNRYAAGDHTK